MDDFKRGGHLHDGNWSGRKLRKADKARARAALKREVPSADRLSMDLRRARDIARVCHERPPRSVADVLEDREDP